MSIKPPLEPREVIGCATHCAKCREGVLTLATYLSGLHADLLIATALDAMDPYAATLLALAYGTLGEKLSPQVLALLLDRTDEVELLGLLLMQLSEDVRITALSVLNADQLGAENGQSKSLSRLDWATLLKRVHTVDALACPECGGRMNFTALVQDKAVARKELQRRGLPCLPPPLARARAPVAGLDRAPLGRAARRSRCSARESAGTAAGLNSVCLCAPGDASGRRRRLEDHFARSPNSAGVR